MHALAIVSAAIALAAGHHHKPRYDRGGFKGVAMTCMMRGEMGGPDTYKVRCWGYTRSKRSE